MNTRLKEIKNTFKKNGIILKEELDDSKKYAMKDSVTNQFVKVEDIHDQQYLIRINGKLWPPFTREAENYNLQQLKNNNINSNVIINDLKQEFQICLYDDEKNRFNEVEPNGNKENLLNVIALGIKKFHRKNNYFKSNYSIGNEIMRTLNHLPEIEQKILYPYYVTILSMLNTLNADEKNHVASHNDLQPSSVYINNKKVSFVDWEYSAENHRSYDLSFFSIKSSLTPEQEQKLVTSYDASDDSNINYSVTMMKPIVNFLLLMWNLSSKRTDAIAASFLLLSLTRNIQDAIYQQSARALLSEMKFFLFHNNKQHVKSISNENLSPKYLTF